MLALIDLDTYINRTKGSETDPCVCKDFIYASWWGVDRLFSCPIIRMRYFKKRNRIKFISHIVG
jgi:hypothetical protein